MTDLFAALAAEHGLLHTQTAPAALTEAYLYSEDTVHRYAFGRWWGAPDPATSDVWILFNPATGDTEQRYRLTLERCVKWSTAAGRTGLIAVNLFAYRHTQPSRSPRRRPVGPANDEVLRAVPAVGARTIPAWETLAGCWAGPRTSHCCSTPRPASAPPGTANQGTPGGSSPTPRSSPGPRLRDESVLRLPGRFARGIAAGRPSAGDQAAPTPPT